jgi:hypothetical protein
LAVDGETVGSAAITLDPVDMAAQKRDAPLRRRAVPEHALERRPPAQQGERLVLGGGGDRCAPGDEVIECVRQLFIQDIDDLAPEGVRVVKLHDSPAPPGCLKVRWWTRIAVDDDHLKAAAGKHDGGEKARRTCTNDDGSHMRSKLR